jgi:protein-disulfide isomerase
MANYASHLATGILCLSSVVIAGAVIKREVSPPSRSGELSVSAPIKLPVHEWEVLLGSGRWLIGDEVGSRATVIVFGDYGCPFCAALDNALVGVDRYGAGAVSVVHVHFPLPAHRLSMDAARSVEYAAYQGKFSDMHGSLYRYQDSLGGMEWERYAEIAGVGSVDSFAACMREMEDWPMIDKGVSSGRKLEIRSTPTVAVNGLMYRGMSSISMYGVLDSIVGGSN